MVEKRMVEKRELVILGLSIFVIFAIFVFFDDDAMTGYVASDLEKKDTGNATVSQPVLGDLGLLQENLGKINHLP